jgi:hypothetical protein
LRVRTVLPGEESHLGVVGINIRYIKELRTGLEEGLDAAKVDLQGSEISRSSSKLRRQRLHNHDLSVSIRMRKDHVQIQICMTAIKMCTTRLASLRYYPVEGGLLLDGFATAAKNGDQELTAEEGIRQRFVPQKERSSSRRQKAWTDAVQSPSFHTDFSSLQEQQE